MDIWISYLGLDSQMPEEMNKQFLTPCLCSANYLDLKKAATMDFCRRGFAYIKTCQSTNLIVRWLSSCS